MTDDKDMPPVEPLSDVAWARVERGLWTRMDGLAPRAAPERPQRRWWIAAPVFAAAAVIVFLVVTRDSPAPGEKAFELAGSDGDVRVVAPPNAPAIASFNDVHIEVAPASAIVMRPSVTVLERGSAQFAVAPRVDRPAFVVLAGDTKVRVLGTKFRVTRVAKNDHVEVEVEHGVVEVQFRGNLVQVRSHESWNSERPETVSPIQTAAVNPTTPSTTSPTEPTTDPTTNPTTKPDVAKPTTKPDVAKPTTKPEVAKPIEDDRAKFDRLTALEKRDPKAAIAGYLELSQRSGAWAANALYAAGRLAVDRSDARATTLLTVYLRRFPSGPNADDARRLLERLKLGSGSR